MRHEHFSQPIQSCPMAHIVRRGGAFAAPVEGQHGRVLERGGMERAGGMSQMVRHEMPSIRAIMVRTSESFLQMVRRTAGQLSRRVHDVRQK
jgi:hypothetical protein